MYDSPNYPTSQEEADRFVDGQSHATLLACPAGGFPTATLLPFVRDGDVFELHGVRDDPTIQALASTGSGSLLVSDFLAWTPHDWVDPANAARATLHFRAVLFGGVVTVSFEPAEVAAVLRRLLERYEPGASYDPVEVGSERYQSRLDRLAAVRLRVETVQRKFKVGPYGPDETKRVIAERLRERAGPGDNRAADVIEQVLSERQ